MNEVEETFELFVRAVGDGVLVTVIVAVAALPLEVFAVIVAVPALMPLTVPFETVATLVSLDVHVIVLFVAFDGETVAVKVFVAPTAILAEVGLTETDVSETVCCFSTTFTKPSLV